MQAFLSTLSLRRATLWVLMGGSSCEHFYPRSPCGERPSYSQHVSRPSGSFLSTLSLRRATASNQAAQQEQRISIHALLAESDSCRGRLEIVYRDFYPRSPCGERPMQIIVVVVHTLISIHALLAESDREPTALRTPHHRFLSTLSLRRATR